MHARRLFIVSAIALCLAACSPAPEGGQGASTAPATTPATSAPADPATNPPPVLQADLDRLKAEGPLPAARAASAFEFWAHYKLMKATGMEEALGGEDQAIAAMQAISLAFERSSVAAQTDVPRMVPTFDGTGMDAGVMGMGYGLLGGAIVGGMLNGGLSQDQVSQAIENGPIKFDGQDGSAEMNIAQDGMDTTLEQNVNENGVTGKVKTKIHIDACPDAEGKLVVTIDTESHMSAGGASGSVKAQFKYERWLDDDAHLIDLGQGGSEENIHIEMSGTGPRGNNLSVNLTQAQARGGTMPTAQISETGHSIFRPSESAHTQQLLDGTLRTMRLMAEAMLSGALTGGKAAWESGRCVDLKLRSDPTKRKGAKPDTRYTVFAEPRAKKDGAPTGGTVRGTLTGAQSLSPQDKVKADAQFDYLNPKEKDQSAKIEFEARSKRGVGRATLEFDTKKGGYRIDFPAGACTQSIKTCDITKPFTHEICGNITLTHTPSDPEGLSGTLDFKYAEALGIADSKSRYTLSGPEDRYTATYINGKVCARVRGLTTCAQPPPSTVTWTRIDDCSQ